MASSTASSFDIRIAPNPPVFDLPVLVALEEGLFVKHGVNLTYAAGYSDREKNPHEQKPLHRLKESLFENGKADTYNVCEWGSIDRIERGKEQRARIAALRPAVAAQAIVTFDDTLQVPRDLVDVEIGINDFTGSHYTTLQLLEGAIGPEHVKTVHVGEPSYRYEQVKSGAIRAATVMEPFISLALKEGGHIVALTFYRGAEVIHPRFTAEQRGAYFAALNEAVARIMVLARSLDGVISGEHGIGITKLEFLTDEELRPFAEYKRKVDPEGRFNKGKLLRNQELPAHDGQAREAKKPSNSATAALMHADLTNAYTPSFGLMGHESLIMQQSDIGAIADSVKDCLRCGKCKPVCSTHVPRANLLYSPRNKILATSLLVEAFLYEEQTRRGVSIQHWQEFEDVADHCTVCHKCYTPCPVKIDFGDVTMNMRNLLRKMGKKSFRPGNALAMTMLNATNPDTIKLMRSAMVDVGFKAQRMAVDLLRKVGRKQTAKPPATVGTAPVKEQVIHFINKKLPGGLPKKTARALLDIEDKDYVPIIRNPATTTADTEAVFYFPGCGSERLFSQVGLATQAMLWHAGVQTVLPPGYLCCGYPQRGSGQFDKAEKMITDNRVLFHRVANTLNYLDIKTVVVSCGTCYDQLQGYQFDKIFPGCRIIDIHEYLLEKGITLQGKGAYLYHEPCHNPMKQQDSLKTVKALVGEQVLKSDRCCGESGTLGVTRPDVSTQVRFRKEEEIRKGEATLRQSGAVGERDNVKILTSCPSCLQGLKRYEDDLQNGLLEADYIVVEMAREILGENWMPEYVQRANGGGIERVLV